ncbi:hypothetical protein JW707_03060 [Candidatus Woesearchaeota archaeon]|nr:hypothetical protein [Candidatus Woesearchaeota archaeon]
MKKKETSLIVKFFSLVSAVLVILNITLFAFGKISIGVFWFIIILMAILAYIILPRTRRKI